MAAPTKKAKKKNIKLVTGILYVTTTSNNTHVTLTDAQGNKVSGGATGMKGFKWAKESTPYAAEVLARDVLKEAKDSFGLKELSIIMRWVWLGREGVFKWLNDVWGIDILSIHERTAIQFGGCQGIRPKRN